MKVKLRDVSNIIMGQSPDSSTYNTEKIGLPFFQGNADFGELNPIAKTWCSAPIKIAYKNYILISVRAPIGALNIAAETCCIGRGLAAFDVNNKMCTQKYLWYLLKAKKNELLSKGTGSTFKAISKNILSEMEFNIPPVREQELCTKVLDVVFCLIRLKKEQLDKLDLLVKSRFIEMFGDPQDNTNKYLLASIIDVSTKVTDGEHGTVPRVEIGRLYLMARNITKNNNLDLNEVSYIPEEYHKRIYERCNPEIGDVLLVCVGATIGKATIVPEMDEFSIARSVALIKPDKRKIKSNYLLYSILSNNVQCQIANCSHAAAQAGLYTNMIKNLKIILPPIDIQNQFADFVAKVDKSKLAIQQSLDELETLKKSLMQQYFG